MNKNIRLLKWFNFFTDFRLYSPIAIIYFAQVSGSFALGMSVFGITQLSAALFEVPTGIFSDYIGRKRTAFLGAIFASFSIMFYALGFNYWILIVGAILEGISRSLYSGNNDALLYATLAQDGQTEEYHVHYGKLGGMFQIALAISALAGGLIATKSLPLVFWLSVVPQLVCVFIASRLIEPRVLEKQTTNIYMHLKDSFNNFFTNPKLRLLSIAHIWSYGFGEASFQFRSAFVNSVWPIWAIGIPQVLSHTGAAIGFSFAGKIINKFGAIKLLLIGTIYGKIINIFSLIFVSVFSPLLMSTTSVFFGLETTAKNTLMQKEFTDKQRATMSSLNSLASSLFFAIAAYLIGAIADRFSPSTALLFVQAITLANVFIYWRLFKQN